MTKANNIAILVAVGAFSTLLSASNLAAQAGPGPLSGPPPSRDETAAQPLPPPRPKLPPVPPRTSLAGSWRYNHDESDDPLRKVRSVESQNAPNTNRGPGSSYPGGGYPYPGGGYPYPGGGYPGGGYPGGGGGAPRNRGEDIADNPKMQPLIHPAEALTVGLKEPEVDVTDDSFRELIFFTDGRQLPKKQTDEAHVQILAHWNGTQLVSDEKSPLSGKMSRTFELSKDGRKLFETLHIENGKSSALLIHYVYDASATDVQNGPAAESDPDHPVLKRHSDDSDSSPQ